ncbi:hypothetical protein EHQ92_12450 [Leptospira biflexa]|jgi:hypothetical protein|uniref:Putative lipoprotein putative signal peptide n=1 Tax=Leptospira biflexa serovar Patoc (strain Patoc 1 / ATCC 23582 / Paris) TaxID=456481 RepID=B0SS47_LEPBP|nr:hypothetical protein [Leptospira biflexa]ABZ94285.1 Hypothetical lipoprotein [Leptospira biflexa serovar Patoc strain 'Patoc 1 (Ames)']ABZ97937.1 Putative lipoprotein; putative signal peptide [Leptospira biflexa serovar Patoc strain 'Patoc 1 (Paris)']TGM36781.1 hypothetical protein EHQ89_08670 [Leptospira biflexa]TGM39765.1 hypothetical protein EHQ80_00775 [Leptospira biflexa]TGM48642.1 hypothetical protein EHQ92_12450 [Leptospira biflexa]
MKFSFHSVLLFLLLSFVSCQTTKDSLPSTSEETKTETGVIKDLLPPPGGEGEIIFNEKGEEVQNHTGEIPFFQKKSDLPQETFRVYIASDSYMVRQIRHSDKIRRKPDPGGDELSKEEMKKFDLLSFVDDGIISIGLNSVTGKLESIAFDRRVPRINDIAKIIQNDASRFNYEHSSKDGSPIITRFLVTYQIRLYPGKTRDEIKQMLQKKK